MTYQCGSCKSFNTKRDPNKTIDCKYCEMEYNFEVLKCQNCMAVTTIKTPLKSRIVKLNQT